jgi:hypothetical protein
MKSISIHDLARVTDYLERINNPQRTEYGNIRHKVIDIIVIAFTAVLCGYEDYQEMEEFGRLKKRFPQKFSGTAKCRMMHVAPNADFLYEALFSE